MGYDEPVQSLPSTVAAASTAAVAPRRERRWKVIKRFALILLAAFSLRHLFRAHRARRAHCTKGAHAHISDPPFDWFSLTPSEDINWTPCFADFQCARLILPLDYLSPPGYGPNVTIALQMLPATDKENYKGTVLINPGGPGGSGTNLAQRRGRNISAIIGPNYDILGFDPRGTGASTPSAQCFDSESGYMIWQMQSGKALKTGDGSVPLARAREHVVAEKCLKALGGNGQEDANGTVEEWGGGRFMSTPSVATDMLKITEKLGQEKLKYWGFSYGSILGQYFSAMYPDKVERVIIDGVFDGLNYRGDLPNEIWNSNLVDMEKVRGSFYDFCHQAGPEKCGLYESSAKQVRTRVDAIIDGLDEQPFPLPFAQGGPKVLTKRDVVAILFLATYKPTDQFTNVAQTILAIEQRNATAAVTAWAAFDPGFECSCGKTPQWEANTEAFYAIACGDSGPVDFDSKNFTTFLEGITEMSPTAGPLWAIHYIQCAEWKVRAKWRYTGPLGANETAHPIMLISPRYDPVCPYADGLKVHARYGGSGQLVQNSYGHCSMSAPSVCTAKYVRAYFQNGTVPEEGAECDVDELPFIGQVKTKEELAAMSAEDVELMQAVKALSEYNFPIFGSI